MLNKYSWWENGIFIKKKNGVENVQTDGQWTTCFVRFNHPGKKGLMSIETLHREAFLASCDWKGYEERKTTSE